MAYFPLKTVIRLFIFHGFRDFKTNQIFCQEREFSFVNTGNQVAVTLIINDSTFC